MQIITDLSKISRTLQGNLVFILNVLSELSIHCTYNHLHNILRLSDVLTNFPFIAIETMRDYYL